MGKVELKVKDHGFVEFFERVAEIKGKKVKVGWLADDGKAGALHEPGGHLTVAEIAATLEFGTQDGHIPARPALQSTFDEKFPELVELGKQLMTGVLLGKITVDKSLNIIGARLANDVKNKITDGVGIPPPNAPSTIEQKGSDRPWVDTGRVINALSWVVTKNDEE